MTDQPSSQSQPSMEDILASIRRIIDDEDTPTPAPTSAVPRHAEPQKTVTSFVHEPDTSAVALADYDEQLAVDVAPPPLPDPDTESIFPQRHGALWRRVAGHPLSEGETDPLPEDDTLDLTETLEDESELELSELLESTGDSDPGDDAKVLDDVVASAPDTAGPAVVAGLGAAAAASTGAMDRIAQRVSSPKDDDADEVLDLTRSLDPEEALSAMNDLPQFEDGDDLPPPVFERVDVSAPSGADESALDRSFETASASGMSDDYSATLAKPDDVDARERALDDRFYQSDDFDDQPPEIPTDYATSLGGKPKTPSQDGAGDDEMETVGGLVRDALKGRLPALPQRGGPDNTPLVSGGAEDSAARSLAALARYDAQSPRRIYGGIKITEDDDSPTIEGMVQDTLRPMLREWLNDNLPTLVENMVKQEVDRISARSRRFVRDDDR